MLFYITPKDSDPFDILFKIELGILFFDYVPILVYVLMIRRAACHINLKLISLFLLLQYAIYITARIIIVFTQDNSVLYPDKPSAATPLIVTCSFFLAYYYILVLTMPFWMSFERILAKRYVYNYHTRSRPWIPAVIIICAILYCSLGAAIFTFEWIFMDLALPLVVDIGVVMAGAGTFFICNIYGYTTDAYKIVRKLSEVQSVIVRYRERNKIKMKTPLELNLFSTKLLLNAIAYTTVLICTTVPGFTAVFYWRYQDVNNRHIANAIFHIFLAIDTPLVTFIGLLFNTYTRNLLRSLVCDPRGTYRQQPSLKIFTVQPKVLGGDDFWTADEAAQALKSYLPAIHRWQRAGQRAVANSFQNPGKPIDD